MDNNRQLWKLKVFHKSGQLLAEGSFKECAEKLKMSNSALRRLEWDHRVNGRKSLKGWRFERESVQARYRMIDCETGKVIDEGTAPELASRHDDISYEGIVQILIHRKRGRKPKIYDYIKIE